MLEDNIQDLFKKSAEEEAKDNAMAEQAVTGAQTKIHKVCEELLKHSKGGMGHLFSEANTFNGELIIDWSVEAAQKYLKEKDKLEKRFYSDKMSDAEAAEFAYMRINYIQHCMQRELTKIFMPTELTDDEFEEVIYDYCADLNRTEEATRVQQRCKEIYQEHKGKDYAFDNDSSSDAFSYEQIVKRAEDSIKRADRRMEKNK